MSRGLLRDLPDQSACSMYESWRITPLQGMKNVVIGANKADTHYQNANLDRDFTVEQFADLRNAQAGDPSPRGPGALTLAKGIEVGQVFLLGTKYSHKMNATILDDQGKERLAIMGCYGIGVGRTAAAAIEQHHDEKGIIWPFPIAPFHVHLLTVSQSEKTTEAAARLYTDLTAAGIEVLWDDRADRAGVKFNDADLIGAPFQTRHRRQRSCGRRRGDQDSTNGNQIPYRTR